MAISFAGIKALIAKAGHTFELNKSVFTTNAMGGRITSRTPSGSPKTCWFQQATDNDAILWGQRGIKISHKCYFSSDPGAKEGDTGTAGGSVSSFLSGNSLVVTGFDDQGGLGQLVVLILDEVKDGSP